MDTKNTTKTFTTKKLVLCAMIVALSFALTFLEIPIFPQVGLKLDFSFSILLIGGYMLGPIYAEISVIATMLLCLIKTSSGGIGEIANFIMANCFVVLPVIIYKYKKGIKKVIITLAICSALQVVVALLCNRFIMYPLYFGENAKVTFSKFWYLVIIFNVIKCVVNGVITILLYKRLKNALHNFLE